jgi:CheY-like chemotaxis protein
MADNNKTLFGSRDIQRSSRQPPSAASGLSQTVGLGLGEIEPTNGSRVTLSSDEKRTVAVIDDDLGIRVSLAVFLKTVGCGAETYDSAEAFLKAAANSMAGCLVVDIQLGDISGIELARQLTDEGFRYPVIFISALNDALVRRQVEAAGCVAFLIKPFAPKLLVDAIIRATGWSIKFPSRDVDG